MKMRDGILRAQRNGRCARSSVYGISPVSYGHSIAAGVRFQNEVILTVDAGDTSGQCYCNGAARCIYTKEKVARGNWIGRAFTSRSSRAYLFAAKLNSACFVATRSIAE